MNLSIDSCRRNEEQDRLCPGCGCWISGKESSLKVPERQTEEVVVDRSDPAVVMGPPVSSSCCSVSSKVYELWLSSSCWRSSDTSKSRHLCRDKTTREVGRVSCEHRYISGVDSCIYGRFCNGHTVLKDDLSA